ncbi:IS66-like element accessory protein TnpA [Roseisalinus antarcticus]|uniref:Transposase n=1 Tax=Roseisalinus antarcticus TaxID=254357 RepID=A0A1Y5U291_9RHOB|nr:transposase [Roseisalinus antarcticus]SLN77222.1 Transposase [Roseisalinus antarcticus]
MGTPKGIKKRFWSDEEKRSICLQTRAPRVSVAQVARRYAMNTNLIHKWLKDPRFAPIDQSEPDLTVTTATDDAVFLPVEVEGVTIVADPTPAPRHAGPAAPLTAQRVDIALSDGRRILVEGTTALAAVVAMVEGLSS